MDKKQTASACLEQIRRRIPEALAFVEAMGDMTLEELSACSPPAASPPQDGEDVIALARSLASGLLSPALGQKIALALERDFRALTANHLGPDFHPEFSQGDIIFALRGLKENIPAVPVLAWGCMPGNSFGHPRGILLGRGRAQSVRPGRLPVLPDKHRWVPLSLREAFTPDQPRRLLEKAVLSSPDCGRLTPAENAAARRLLAEVFCHPRVLEQKSYGDQATVMNSLLWERLFAPSLPPPPPLISLDMTLFSLEIIRRDLFRPHSLIRCLLEPEVSVNLLHELNEVMGCWNLDRQGRGLSSGSFLFWGIDRRKNFRPLSPDAACRRLLSADGSIRLDLEPGALEAALAQRRILPGLLISFSALALARGLLCRGGVYQIGYLENMRRGVMRALSRSGEKALAEKLEHAPAGAMIGGFIPLRLREETPLPERGGEPEEPCRVASPVDILAGGGLGADTLERLAAMPGKAAFAATLPFHYEEIVPSSERLPGWLPALADNPGLFPDGRD
ncbi:MAG: hypothetical protein LBQ63_04680 [Deltaproteobacteria bacterium]|nr:hypothetical protein [Deltaproteobacteria bacterium]